MLKIGVIGTGHLGKIHLRLLKEISGIEVAGIYDTDNEVATSVAETYAVQKFDSAEALIECADAIDIVAPTFSHFIYASKAIKKFKHVFIEKPLCHSVKEAKQLLSLCTEAGIKGQVGHVERFNPSFLAALPYFDKPMFIESHRLALFNPRGTDVSVVLDLMIHDIDIILSVVKSTIKKISASGVAVVSDTPDIANARIEFDNGCVANLTASRISLKNMRKSRFFQKDAYISVDFLDKKTEVVRISTPAGKPDPLAVSIDLGKEKGTRIIHFETPQINDTNAIKTELTLFAQAIHQNTIPPVTIEDGYHALSVAHQIIDKFKPIPNAAL